MIFAEPGRFLISLCFVILLEQNKFNHLHHFKVGIKNVTSMFYPYKRALIHISAKILSVLVLILANHLLRFYFIGLCMFHK